MRISLKNSLLLILLFLEKLPIHLFHIIYNSLNAQEQVFLQHDL